MDEQKVGRAPGVISSVTRVARPVRTPVLDAHHIADEGAREK
jgi:hypothetical protein